MIHHIVRRARPFPEESRQQHQRRAAANHGKMTSAANPVLEVVREVSSLLALPLELEAKIHENHMGLPGRINPALAPGMTLDERNGCISGAPTQRTSLEPVVHTVMATNKVGRTTCHVEIDILVSP